MYFFVAFAVLVISATCNGQSNPGRSSVCTSRNMYANLDGNCDTYIECQDYQIIERECPDGLNFDPNAQWPAYPCGYPQDVPCVGRRSVKAPNPTADCARQYGYFRSPLAHENDCGHYRLCNGGVAFDMYCPGGLAFNTETAQCDWPELVPSCNVENYVGFKCPAPTVDELGFPITTNHKYNNECYFFYSCVNGKARVLSCDNGFAFNAATGRCEIAESVSCAIDGSGAVARSQAAYY